MRPRILVVDDEPDLLELLRFNLDQAGMTVETAASAVVRGGLASDAIRPPTLPGHQTRSERASPTLRAL